MSRSNLYETARYAIVVDNMVSEGYKDTKGYILVNKETGVREGETTSEIMAIRTMRDSQADYDMLMSDEDEVIDNEEFNDLVKRLRDEAE